MRTIKYGCALSILLLAACGGGGSAGSGGSGAGGSSEAGTAGSGGTGATDGGAEAGNCTPNDTQPCSETASGDPITFPDFDANGNPLGACKFGVRTCAADGTWGTDCVGAVGPTVEVCAGNDNDCDGVPSAEDPDATDQLVWSYDQDGDGYRDAKYNTVTACTAPPAAPTGCTACPADGWVSGPAPLPPGDCDDTADTVNPAEKDGPPNFCDGLDNDCDGAVDQGCSCVSNTTRSCGPSNDTGACKFGVETCSNGVWGTCVGAVYPSTEKCDNLDDNCNGQVDEGCDVDNDNYCTNKMTIVGTPSTCTNGGGDCNDGKASIHPNATETCNGIDDDCNNVVDDAPWAHGGAAVNTACYVRVPLPTTIPSSGNMYLNSYGGPARGDSDFAGHGPVVATDWIFQIVSNKVQLSVSLTARETTSDWTQIFGMSKLVAIPTPYDGKVVEIIGTDRMGFFHSATECNGTYSVPNFPQFPDWQVIYTDSGSTSEKSSFFQFPSASCNFQLSFWCRMNFSGGDWGKAYCRFTSSGNYLWIRRLP